MALRFTKADKDPEHDEYLIYEEVDALLADGTAGKALQPLRSVSISSLKVEITALQEEIDKRQATIDEITSGKPLEKSLAELVEERKIEEELNP